MKSAIDIVNSIRKTPQYKMSIEIMTIFSAYNSDKASSHAEYTLYHKIYHHFKFSHKYFNALLAGSRKINAKSYYQVIDYLCSLPDVHEAMVHSGAIIYK